MRRFKVGDRVRAFLDAKISGVIVNITQIQATQWIAEGTASVEFLAEIKLNDGSIRKIKMSELMHEDF